MKFRTAFLVSIVMLIGAVGAATAFLVGRVLDQSEVDRVKSNLVLSRQVYQGAHANQQAQYRTKARGMANEPRLRAVVDSEDADPATVFDVARTLHKTMRTDLFLILEADGYLLTDVADPDAEGKLSDETIVVRALKEGEASEIWTPPGKMYLMSAQRMDFGTRVSGVLITGHALTDSNAQFVSGQIGAGVVVMLDGAVMSMAGIGTKDARPGAELIAEALKGLDPKSLRPVEVQVGGVRYFATASRFDDYYGERDLRYVVLRNFDDALAPGRRVKRIMLIIIGSSILVAILVGLFLSWRLSRPIDELVAFTRAVAAGDLDRRAQPTGLVEVRTLGEAMNKMVHELQESRQQLLDKERLENEMEIAQRIQVSILPPVVELEGLEIAARMVPADEVGGDYYDFVPVQGGGWIGIGDVSGHGLSAGLVMMMMQTGVLALVESDPDGSPADIVAALNRVLYENVKRRLVEERHATFTLLRYHRDGRLVLAGAHMDILLLRADAEACEQVVTPGTWLCIVEDVERVTKNTTLELGDGDLIVLYTDGVTEAMSAEQEQFGAARLCKVVEQHRDEDVTAIRDAILAAAAEWQETQEDDVTAVVLRYRSG